jgi:hypothetical protein
VVLLIFDVLMIEGEPLASSYIGGGRVAVMEEVD